jgi:hypothetical protein
MEFIGRVKRKIIDLRNFCGDGVFLEILRDDGTIRDVEFIKGWITGVLGDGS